MISTQTAPSLWTICISTYQKVFNYEKIFWYYTLQFSMLSGLGEVIPVWSLFYYNQKTEKGVMKKEQ